MIQKSSLIESREVSKNFFTGQEFYRGLLCDDVDRPSIVHRSFLLQHISLKTPIIKRNPTLEELYEDGLLYDDDTYLLRGGALVTRSGVKTGRSPLDKRIVRESGDAETENIWFGAKSMPHYPMDNIGFKINRERAVDYLNLQKRVYIVDAWAGWDTNLRLKVRIICNRPYHALFMKNMLVAATEKELKDWHDAFVIYNAGSFPCNKYANSMTSSTSIAINFTTKEMVILGSEYAGEMKKGVFTIMNYYMPKYGHLSLHSSCNVGLDDPDDVTLFFGLSGTGKTSLSTDPQRGLIGDDEHVWTKDGIFNIEGGCYAKCLNLSRENEPDIFNAIRYGAILENVNFDTLSRVADFTDKTITENTRCSYPISHITGAVIPCLGRHPRNVIFLTCDGLGIFPAVAKLSKEQALYYFVSGFTSKVAGTEIGIKEPIPVFSSCFGEPFLVWHPLKYAELFKEKMADRGEACNVWLISTGWVGQPYGPAHHKRIPIKYSRTIIDAIHSESLKQTMVKGSRVGCFGLEVPVGIKGVPDRYFNPREMWENPVNYDKAERKLAGQFKENFKRFGDYYNQELVETIRLGGPE